MVGVQDRAVQQSLSEYEAVLVEVLEAISALLECMKAEREAMVFLDTARLMDTYKEKHSILVRLDTLEKSRSELTGILAQHLRLVKGAGTREIMQHLETSEQTKRIGHCLSCIKSIAQAVQELNAGQRKFAAYSLSDIETSMTLIDKLQKSVRNPCYDEKGSVQERHGGMTNTMMDRTI